MLRSTKKISKIQTIVEKKRRMNRSVPPTECVTQSKIQSGSPNNEFVAFRVRQWCGTMDGFKSTFTYSWTINALFVIPTIEGQRFFSSPTFFFFQLRLLKFCYDTRIFRDTSISTVVCESRWLLFERLNGDGNSSAWIYLHIMRFNFGFCFI